MNFFNYILLVIVMIMSFNIVGDITCIKILFSIVIIVSDIE